MPTIGHRIQVDAANDATVCAQRDAARCRLWQISKRIKRASNCEARLMIILDEVEWRLEHVPFRWNRDVLSIPFVGACPYRKTGSHFSGTCANVRRPRAAPRRH